MYSIVLDVQCTVSFTTDDHYRRYGQGRIYRVKINYEGGSVLNGRFNLYGTDTGEHIV